MDPFSLIGLIGGAVTRLFPTLFDFLKQGRDLKFEVMRMDKEIELERLRGQNAQAELVATASVGVDKSWADAMIEAVKCAIPPQVTNSGSFWLNFINGMNASVRPFLTYWWCVVVYTAGKIILCVILFQEHQTLKEAYPLLITDFDRSVISSLIGFWFVDRALRSGNQK